ncbi:MAG: hypothetical protein IT342_19305 [Candidatus Melainabacteria bacterium]|nr:hypothetical protein [Candidatus Melainabacteria bacterium]
MTITNLTTNFEPPIMDPASLEGLEPLLDRVFSAAPPAHPDVRPFMTPIAPPAPGTINSGELFGVDDEIEIISSGAPRSSDSAEANMVINELCATIDLLRAQLSFSNSELRFAHDRNRWLEMQIATREDQLRLMPDLMTRAAQVTVAERELKVIQADADRLLDDTREIREIAEQLSLSLNESLKDLEDLSKPLWKRTWDFLIGRNLK